jgi:hypothetical protein
LAKGRWEEILKDLFQTAKLIQIEILVIIQRGITNGVEGALLLISFLKILQAVPGESDAVKFARRCLTI